MGRSPITNYSRTQNVKLKASKVFNFCNNINLQGHTATICTNCLEIKTCVCIFPIFSSTLPTSYSHKNAVLEVTASCTMTAAVASIPLPP